MSWKPAQPDHPVRFERGEPICMVVPVPRGLAEGLEPLRVPLRSHPELHQQDHDWGRSRAEFSAALGVPGSAESRRGWQKDYIRGVMPSGARAVEHQTSLRLEEFAVSRDPSSEQSAVAGPPAEPGHGPGSRPPDGSPTSPDVPRHPETPVRPAAPRAVDHRPGTTPAPRERPATVGGPPRRPIEAGIGVIRRRWPGLRNDCAEDPIFILAAGWRTGSTLLQRLVMHECFVWGEPFGHAWLIDSLADHLRCFTETWPEAHHFYRDAEAEALSRKFIANLYPSIQDLLRAHQGFFEKLFIEPARRAGAGRWGLKEVRLGVDHATYLRWLFPRAKFLFLIRNPYDAWRSYAARAARGWKWYNRWPDQPVTVRSFAAHWRDLVAGFLEGHRKVDGLLVKYEDLARGEFATIEDYLGFRLSDEAARVNPSDGGPPALKTIPESDRIALDAEAGALAASLGYSPDHAERPEPDAGRVALRAGPPDHDTNHPERATEDRPGKSGGVKAMGNSRCVILVPVGHHIEPACDDALRELERRGHPVRRVRGYSAIDQGRNQIATDALGAGFEELMWIDSDVAFEPEAVDRLRSHGEPIVCGVYPKKGRRAFACNFPPGATQVTFGKGGGLIEVPYAGAGFLYTRREVYETMQQRLRLPTCNEQFGPPMIPFFHPMIIPDGDSHWYLAEDYSFCRRARDCGFRIYADTTIRLKHIGSYAYTWEDAGGEPQRFASFTFHIWKK